MASGSLTTRKMSARHEDDLVEMLGGVRTRNSGAVWADQTDGHQTNLDQHWRFSWDGKSTLGKSVSVTREMLAKLREQCRLDMEPMLPLRWYANDRLSEVDEDWIAIEAETMAAVLKDANALRRVKEWAEENDDERALGGHADAVRTVLALIAGEDDDG